MYIDAKNLLLIALLVSNLSGCAGYYHSRPSLLVEKELPKALLLVPKDELKELAGKAVEEKKAVTYNDDRAMFIVRKEAQPVPIVAETGEHVPDMCAESRVFGACPAPGVIVAVTTGANIDYSCVTPGATAATCTDPKVFDAATSECKVHVSSCTGVLPIRASTNKDNKIIYREVRIYNEKSSWCGRTIWVIFPIPLWEPGCQTFTELTYENGKPTAAREQFIEGSGYICGPFVPFMGMSDEPFPRNFCARIIQDKPQSEIPVKRPRSWPRL